MLVSLSVYVHYHGFVYVFSEEFFTIGTMYEKKGIDDDAEMARTDPRKLRKRVRRVLSLDGTKFYNLWFIPHFLEVLFVFRQLDDEAATRALRSMCKLASALHDIVHYLIAFARLGINASRISAEQRAQVHAMASAVRSHGYAFGDSFC